MDGAPENQLFFEILSYLDENPDAHDTLEGIIQWWLLERKIERKTVEVKEAIAELVVKGLVVEHKSSDLRTHYRINPKKSAEIRVLLQQESRNPDR